VLNDTSSLYIGLEFIGLPVSIGCVQAKAEKYDGMDSPTCNQDGSGVQDTPIYNLEFNFTLPLHFRYQPPTSDCVTKLSGYLGGKSGVNNVEILKNPRIYARINNDSNHNVTDNSNASKGNQWLYSVTKLGREGNYKSLGHTSRITDGYYLSASNTQILNHISFLVPTTCAHDLQHVLFGTETTLVITTVIIMLVICLKLLV
jgi:hypothetical protein